MGNSNLTKAKKEKNDEFYTQFHDIEKEINSYLDYNPDVFRDKTVLLPCDDPEWSNFTLFFAQNFERFGMKKLISTSYSANTQEGYHPTSFEVNDPQYDEKKTMENGKIFTLTHDISGDGKVDINDLVWEYLDGNGDFNSPEVKKLRDESDIVITNPPFSLFRNFLAWIMEANKQFVTLGSINAITYKEVFPLIKENKIWLGSTNGVKVYNKPDGTEEKMGNTCWFTNIDHGRRHQPLNLMTEVDVIKFVTKKPFVEYDNYDAIEVPYVKQIPNGYDGVMGVPISFLDKYNPNQFEILGTSDNGLIDDKYKKTPGLTKEFVDNYYRNGGTGTYREGNPTAGRYENNVAKMVYKRIFIKHKQNI